MKSKAILMALAMMTTALAGCTGGTDGVPEVDEDALNELIQNNLQDFINNTTVVVNQDFHYHNNTTYVVDDGDYSSTVVNEYNNTTNVDGGEVNNYNSDNSNTNYTLGGGEGASSIMQMFTVSWNPADEIVHPDYGSRIVELNGTLQQTSGEPTLLYALIIGGHLIEFRDLTCEEVWNYGNLQDHDWWDFIWDEYGEDASYPVPQQLQNFWYSHMREYSTEYVDSSGQTVREQCDFDSSYVRQYVPAFEIQIPQGQAIHMLTGPSIADYYLECEDGYAATLNGQYGNSSGGGVGSYIGGQSNCTLSGIAEIYSYHGYDNYTTNMSSSSNIPEWWPENYWRSYTIDTNSDGSYNVYTGTPYQFSVYFMTYFVEVYDHGTV